MDRKRLPKNKQVLREIREGGYYYVDKTAYVSQLIQEESTNIFLSRPRRFGKSLFVNTIKEAFEGNEELFEGLAIHDKWDWSKKHPVIHLSFSSGHFQSTDGLISTVNSRLQAVEKSAGLESSEPYPSVRLFNLIKYLYAQYGNRVVLLVDEYDKPILDVIERPDIAVANCDLLASLYGVIEDVPEEIRFSFFTGVSMLAKSSLLSGMGNFEDITVSSRYSSICGYTESDIDSVFAPELDGLDGDDISEWYNGYSWLGREKVYNPYDILYLFGERRFGPWWFKTGSPRFLIDTLKTKGVMPIELNSMRPRTNRLESFDVDGIDPLALLFQAGYLTIVEKSMSRGGVCFKLDYPNREVRENLNLLLLELLLPGESEGLLEDGKNLLEYLLECNVEEVKNHLQKVLACLPRQWHAPVDHMKYEAYFASALYSYLMGVGLVVRVEKQTCKGRIDMVLEGPSYVYLFELKLVDPGETGVAMEQIEKMNYAQKCRGSSKPLYLAGVEISRKTHNIVGFSVKKDDGGKQSESPNGQS